MSCSKNKPTKVQTPSFANLKTLSESLNINAVAALTGTSFLCKISPTGSQSVKRRIKVCDTGTCCNNASKEYDCIGVEPLPLEHKNGHTFAAQVNSSKYNAYALTHPDNSNVIVDESSFQYLNENNSCSFPPLLAFLNDSTW